MEITPLNIAVVSIVLFIGTILMHYVLHHLNFDVDSKTTAKTHKDFHLKRRVQHISTCSSYLLLCSIVIQDVFFIRCATAFLLVAGSILNWIRVHVKPVNEFFYKNFLSVLREEELYGTPTALYFISGVLIDFTFFKKHVAYLGFIAVTYGDPFASFFGLLFKSRQLRKGKSLSGTLAAAIICSFASFVYFYFNSLLGLLPGGVMEVVLVSGIIGGMAEFLPASKRHFLDDNLTIQLYTSILWTGYLWGRGVLADV